MTSTFRIRQVNRPRAGAGRWREDELIEGVLAPARRPGSTTGTGGRDWLHSRLYACRGLHDTLLAERVPAVLESLPAGVDRWFFLRPSDADPHLRLSFGGDAPALWTPLLSNLRGWIAELVSVELATRLTVDVCQPLVGDPVVLAEAEDVLHADSDAVLAQLRLAHAGAFAVRSDVLAEFGLADVARAFRGMNGRVDRAPAGHADHAADGPGLALLTPWREARARALARYGDRVRRLAADGDDAELVSTVLDSLLRLHGNRVNGNGGARWSG